MHGGTYKWPVAVLALLALSAGRAEGQAEGDPITVPSPDLAVRVEDLESALMSIQEKEEAAKKKAAGKPTVSASGRLHLDLNSFHQNAASINQLNGTAGTAAGNLPSGVAFRRARLRLVGEAFEVVDYSAEFDFAGENGADKSSVATYKDVYIGVKELPCVGNFRVGHFREPFGLEQLTSTNFSTLMERSLGDDGAIVPARNLGAMFFNAYREQQGTWAIGAFATDPQQAEKPPFWFNDQGGYALTMRGTCLLWYDEATEGRGLIHTGAACSYRDNARAAGDAPAYRFRARPEAGLSPRVLDLKLPSVVDVQLFGAELAVVYGPFSVQGEYFRAFADCSGANADPTFHGGYAYASYFLTGENRPYRRSHGTFDRVIPLENFLRVRDAAGHVRVGKGAWEVAYRYSYLDLLDALPIASANNGAGRVFDHTVGVNWYLNPYTRMMFNYVWTDMSRVTGGKLISGGHIDTLEMRAQIDF